MKTKVLYNCSQSNLYPSGRLGWTSCSQNLAAFTAAKLKYTAPFVLAKLAAIEVANNLQGNQARAAVSESLRIELVAMASTNRDNFQMLKRYIADAFATDMQKPQYEAAGQEFYYRAIQNNWGAVESLNDYADNYITANDTKLTADGYMPATFATKVSDDRAAFAAKHLDFMNQEEHEEEGTQEKIIANNGIFTDLMSMLLDGQEIFKNDPAKYKQFVFAEILQRASSVGQSGVRGVVRDSVTNLPIAGAEIMILLTSDITITNVDGVWEFRPYSAGRYDIRFTAPGHHDKVINQFQISSGTVSSLDVMLDPL